MLFLQHKVPACKKPIFWHRVKNLATSRKIKSQDVHFDFISLSFWAFTLSVCLLPVGLGGNRPVPFGLAQLGLGLSCIFLLLGHRTWSGTRIHRRLRWALATFVAVIVWAFLQTFPYVPASWIHPLWQEAANTLGTNIHGTIAIAPEDATAGLIRLITYIVCGFLAFCLMHDAGRAHRLLWSLWISGVGICLYGLLIYILGTEKILWFDKWSYVGDLTATFVNRNHFAIYAGMILVCGLSLTIQSWRNAIRAVSHADRINATKEWLLHKGLALCFALFLVFLSIILSHSRAGLVLSIVGPGCYLSFFSIYRKKYRRALIIAISFVLLLGIAAIMATEYSERFASLTLDSSSEDRQTVYWIVVKAIENNPFLGYGLNGFQPIFRLYRTDSMIMEFNRAHCDILESILDLGVIAGLALWSAIGLLLSGLARGIRYRQHDGMYPAVGLAVSAMVIGHAAVDFSLQIPGIVFLWATLLGTGLAQSWGNRK